MLFKFSVLAALAVSASAAVIPRDSTKGYWDAYITVSENGSQYFYADFYSDAYPEKLRNTCVLDTTTDPVFKRCDQTRIDWSYDGTTLKINQLVENGMRVFGEVELATDEDLGDGRMKGHARVDVTSATA